MITLSAPTKSGYRENFATVEEAQENAAWILDVTVEDMVEVESGDGGTTYCYATQEEADADSDGAYAVKYSGSEDAPKLDRSDVFVDLDQGENRDGHAFGFVGLNGTSDYQGWFFDYPSDRPIISTEAELESVLLSLNLDSETSCSDDPIIPVDWAREALEARLRERFAL